MLFRGRSLTAQSASFERSSPANTTKLGQHFSSGEAVCCVSKTRTDEARITFLAYVTTKRRALISQVSVAATNVSWLIAVSWQRSANAGSYFRK